MSRPQICQCGHQRIRHAGWQRSGHCNECRRGEVMPCKWFVLHHLGERARKSVIGEVGEK